VGFFLLKIKNEQIGKKWLFIHLNKEGNLDLKAK
jgi:hypothetical protein